jgi:hypothetical protein
MAAQLASVGCDLDGTFVLAPGRVGTIGSQLAGIQAAISGQYAASASRTGVINSGLAGVTSLIRVTGGTAPARYILEDFELGYQRVVQPDTPGYYNRFLFYIKLDGYPDSQAIVTSPVKEGQYALRITANVSGDFQTWCYTYMDNKPGWPNAWTWVHRFVNNAAMTSKTAGSPAWIYNHFDRIKFWIKIPPGMTKYTDGSENMHFGTYLKVAEHTTGSDDSNMHYYHKLNMASSGQWEQVIIDMHPDHRRGNAGSTEIPDNPQANGAGQNVAGKNYFDLMSGLYLDLSWTDNPLGDHFIDGFEFYKEPYAEDTANIRSLHAVYIPSTNTISFGYRRNKNLTGETHQIRYAFQNIHEIGWNNATVADNIYAGDSNGYNGVDWATNAINVAGQSILYLGVKSPSSSLFRQIAIPVS